MGARKQRSAGATGTAVSSASIRVVSGFCNLGMQFCLLTVACTTGCLEAIQTVT